MPSKTYAFAVGAVIGLMLALAPSCGTSSGCTPSSCGGCCTSDGRCATGQTAASCGKNGSQCKECTGNDGCSSEGVCGVLSNNGGGANGGGSANGGSSNGGGTTSTGGGHAAGGGSAAGGGHAVTGGGPGGGPATGGGSSGTGGTTGAGGGMLGTCGNSNCADGCCVGTTCVRGAAQNDNQCGSGGFGCLMCASGNTCTAGACMGATVCGQANCAGGCCTSANTCLVTAQQSDSSCGANGAACASCGAQSCQSGVCAQAAALGGPCSASAQCSSLGAGAYCKLSTADHSATYPGGFCTLPCTGAAGDACASGSGVCIGGATSVIAVYGESDLFCTPTCPTPGNQSTCRNGGYACYGDTSGFCWLNPIPAFDGGGIPNKLGGTCAQDSTCQNPPDPEWGFCLAALDDMSMNTGFTSGYCVADCTYDNTGNFCGPNGGCFDFSDDPMDGGPIDPLFLCLRSCPNPGGGFSSLRPSNTYVCRSATGDDGGTVGYLWPACNQPGRTCPAGTTCKASSGYCCAGTTCYN